MQLVTIVTYSDMWDVCIGVASSGRLLILNVCFLVHVILLCHFLRSVPVPPHLSIRSSVCPSSVHPFIMFIHPSALSSTHPFMHLSFLNQPRTHLPLHPSVCPPVIHPSICSSVRLSVHLLSHSSTHPSICPCACRWRVSLVGIRHGC